MKNENPDTGTGRSAELSARAAALNAWHNERHGGGVKVEISERPAPSMSTHTCARCAWEWRTPTDAPAPRACPRCKARKWQEPLPPRVSDTRRKCLICGHSWKARRAARPGTCPACGSPYWDAPEKMKHKHPRTKAAKTAP